MTWVCPTCDRRYPDSGIGLPADADADEMTRCQVCDEEHDDLAEVVAWAFVVESDHPGGEPFERVQFRHPRETYGTVDGLTVRDVRPLYEGDDL